MTMPDTSALLYQAALQRRLGAPDATDTSTQMADSAEANREYRQNSELFQKPSNVNRRGTQNLKTANMAPRVVV